MGGQGLACPPSFPALQKVYHALGIHVNMSEINLKKGSQMEKSDAKIEFNRNIVLVGFGCIGQAIIPLLFRHLTIFPNQLNIIATDKVDNALTKEYQLSVQPVVLTEDNFHQILNPLLKEGDLLLNLSIGVSSAALIDFCNQKKVLYIDSSVEPWEGADDNLVPADRTNYAIREQVLELKKLNGPTAIITHGANPGLVSHFVKQALLNIAKDNNLETPTPKTKREWAQLACDLQIKTIHVAERDTQVTNSAKPMYEFRNTWSINSLIYEALQPAELTWGTHERHWPQDAFKYSKGSRCSIYLNRAGVNTKVRSWTPTYGAYHGFLITHAESISLGQYLTIEQNSIVTYKPTVHYAYLPSPDTVQSFNELKGYEWSKEFKPNLLSDDISEGIDELGVLLMGNNKGAYWFGSQLSIQRARELAPYNSATSLQVAAGVMAGIVWAHLNPDKGLVEPEEIDFEFILNFARPYLGTVAGYYTNWTPLENRNTLFPEEIDHEDPWQFLNIRVD